MQQLGFINKKRKEVGLEERADGGGLYAQFRCGENTVELRGAMIGVLTPVRKTIKEGQALNDEIVVNKETGRNQVTHFEGGPEAVMEIQINGGGFNEIPIEDSGVFTPEEGTLKVKTAAKGPELVIKEKKKKIKK